jgi:hypothetical protein
MAVSVTSVTAIDGLLARPNVAAWGKDLLESGQVRVMRRAGRDLMASSGRSSGLDRQSLRSSRARSFRWRGQRVLCALADHGLGVLWPLLSDCRGSPALVYDRRARRALDTRACPGRGASAPGDGRQRRRSGGRQRHPSVTSDIDEQKGRPAPHRRVLRWRTRDRPTPALIRDWIER